MPLDEEPLHRPDGQGAVDVAAAAGALAGRRAHVGAHRRDRVGLARQDVALFEAPLGGEVEVTPAVRADGAGLLALDVALEPGGVHGLDEELLGLVEGHGAGRAFPAGAGRATESRGVSRRRRAREYQAGRRRAQRATLDRDRDRADPARTLLRRPRPRRAPSRARNGVSVDGAQGRSYAGPSLGAAYPGRHGSIGEPFRDRVPGPRHRARHRRRGRHHPGDEPTTRPRPGGPSHDHPERDPQPARRHAVDAERLPARGSPPRIAVRAGPRGRPGRHPRDLAGRPRAGRRQPARRRPGPASGSNARSIGAGRDPRDGRRRPGGRRPRAGAPARRRPRARRAGLLAGRRRRDRRRASRCSRRRRSDASRPTSGSSCRSRT